MKSSISRVQNEGVREEIGAMGKKRTANDYELEGWVYRRREKRRERREKVEKKLIKVRDSTLAAPGSVVDALRSRGVRAQDYGL